MNSFERMNIQGIRVQELVKQHLAARGHKIIDVSQNKDYQKVDIDFIVAKDGNRTTLEVKKDKSLFTTRNIFIECGFMKGNYYSAGWLKYCQADYICYYDTSRRRGIIVDRAKLLSLLDQGKEKTFYDKYDQKQGKAILLPLDIAYQNNAIVHEWLDN